MFAQTQNELHNMKHMSILAVSLLALVACTPEKKQEADYSQYVNPMIGTDFTGNTYPGAQVPFGMVQLSPDNGLPGWDRISGYFYPDTTIAGFSHTHLSGTGAGDLYDISFMPVTRPYKEAPAPLGIYSTFSHNDEAASAGYYRVLLKDYNINVELTATERCGIQRYTFPEAEASVFLNLKKAMNWDFTLDSKIEVVDSTTIRGYRLSQGWSPLQHVYFETRFSKPFVACHMDTTSIVTKEKGWIGTAYVARFDFNTKKDEEILVTTGISGVSMEGAGKNLRAEAPKDDFDYYQAQASANWNRQLSKIEVKSRNTDDMVKFYTALYHSMIAPTIYSDVDGSYYGPDQQIHKADGWTNYSTFSLWDTYRALNPLMTITQPEMVDHVVNSMISIYRQQDKLPIWPLMSGETDQMPGYSSVPVIADAYLKGFTGFDAEEALQAMIATATYEKQKGVPYVVKKGYIPADKVHEATSIAMEYAVDDWGIAAMARKMGKTEDAETFSKRAHYYKNYFDSSIHFIRPKLEDGSWRTPYDPARSIHTVGDFCEGNGWQYTFFAPQDPYGLIALFGGDKSFTTKLDGFFTNTDSMGEEASSDITGLIGQYAHGNEPSHHVAYLYAYAGEQWKTAEKVRFIMSDFYTDQPDGIIGNEDCGQMSAWYLLSSMGLYQVNPSDGVFVFGSPCFKKVEVKVRGGNTFTVEAPNNSKENIYIQKVYLNGKPYDKSYITYQGIINGSTLKFVMGKKPNKNFGKAPANRPVVLNKING